MQPTVSALDHPTFGQQDKPKIRLRTQHHLQNPSKGVDDRMQELFARKPTIYPDSYQARQSMTLLVDLAKQLLRALPLLVCWQPRP
jgi:hypothetical protein